MIIVILFWVSLGFLLYVYLGYPLLIAVLACLRPKQAFAWEHFPSVSLIIAAYNEENIIQQKLENALKLDYPQGQTGDHCGGRWFR